MPVVQAASPNPGIPGTVSNAPRLGGDRAPRRDRKPAPAPTKTTIDRRCQPPV